MKSRHESWNPTWESVQECHDSCRIVVRTVASPKIPGHPVQVLHGACNNSFQCFVFSSLSSMVRARVHGLPSWFFYKITLSLQQNTQQKVNILSSTTKQINNMGFLPRSASLGLLSWPNSLAWLVKRGIGRCSILEINFVVDGGSFDLEEKCLFPDLRLSLVSSVVIAKIVCHFLEDSSCRFWRDEK